MPLTRRYQPPYSNGPAAFGMDFSSIIPAGMTIVAASCNIRKNTQPPAAQTDITISAPVINGRIVYAIIEGGVVGTDYLFNWSVTDNRGNTFDRSALMLCSLTA